jgi:hypothetical protein
MAKKNVYRKLIDNALAMPKHEPPKYEPIPKSKIAKMTETLTRPLDIRRDAELAYNVIVNMGRTRTTLSKRVPVSKLNETMAAHIMKFTGEAIVRGGLPLKVFVLDRFAAFLDFGDSRVLKIHVRIDEKPKAQSLASFVVEQATEEDFEKLDLGFEPVDSIPYKETTIQSALIWQDKPKTNGKGNQQ